MSFSFDQQHSREFLETLSSEALLARIDLLAVTLEDLETFRAPWNLQDRLRQVALLLISLCTPNESYQSRTSSQPSLSCRSLHRFRNSSRRTLYWERLPLQLGQPW